MTLLLQTPPAYSALVSMVSEDLSDRPVPDFEAEGLDGKILRFADLRGHPIVVNFMASWCPVCQAENQDLRKLQAGWGRLGIKFIGVLVDPVETPDTVTAARLGLTKDPLPYPVVMMNDSLRAAFLYQGFPATYFIRRDGTFTTSLLGYHPLEKLGQLAARLSEGAGANPPLGTFAPSGSPSGTPPRQPWDEHPVLAMIPKGWAQWHPLVIHFPIVLLVFEGAAVAWYLRTPSEDVDRLSLLLLWLAALSFIPAFATGLRDVGADLGPGWALWNGLWDRIDHLFLFRSTVSLHVILALSCGLLTALRLMWRVQNGVHVLEGRQRAAFILTMLVGLWTLLAAGQVGGGLSHR